MVAYKESRVPSPAKRWFLCLNSMNNFADGLFPGCAIF